jgi:hypothetical protein
MKIEFAIIGDGTNVQVLLLEDLGFLGTEHVETPIDRIYTADHQGGLHFGEDRGVPISARDLFEWVESCWAPPVIGGRYAYLHPYWAERAEARKRRAKA